MHWPAGLPITLRLMVARESPSNRLSKLRISQSAPNASSPDSRTTSQAAFPAATESIRGSGEKSLEIRIAVNR